MFFIHYSEKKSISFTVLPKCPLQNKRKVRMLVKGDKKKGGSKEKRGLGEGGRRRGRERGSGEGESSDNGEDGTTDSCGLTFPYLT